MDYGFILELIGILCFIIGVVAVLYVIVSKQRNKSRFWCYNFDLPHYKKYSYSRRMKN